MSGQDIITGLMSESVERWSHKVNASSNGTAQDSPAPDMTGSLALAFLPFLTMLSYLGLRFLLDYALYDVVLTLAMVETPTVGIRRHSNTDKYIGLMEDEKAISQRPGRKFHAGNGSNFISSGIRGISRHLQVEAGDLSMLRGLSFELCLTIAHRIVTWALRFLLKPVQAIAPSKVVTLIIEVVASLVLVQWSAAWTQIIISKPRHKFWFRRLPLTFVGVFKSVWRPVVALTLAEKLFDWLQIKYFKGYHSAPTDTGSDVAVATVGLFYVLWKVLVYLLRTLVPGCLDFLLIVPVRTLRRRIEASFLPWSDDPIVPVDRSFGSGSSSSTVQDPQPITMISAWRSLDRHMYLRLAKLYAKFWFIERSVEVVFGGLSLVQIALLFGSKAMYVLFKAVLDIPLTQADVDGTSGIVHDALQRAVGNTTVSAAT